MPTMPPLHPTPDLAPESNPVPCAKVQPMDLQATFPADSLRQGPTPGPSGKFSTPFFAPRSSLWTFRQVFNTIPYVKVQPMDLQATFPADSLRQGPTFRQVFGLWQVGGVANNHLAINNLPKIPRRKKRTRNVCKTLCIRWLAITSNQQACCAEAAPHAKAIFLQ